MRYRPITLALFLALTTTACGDDSGKGGQDAAAARDGAPSDASATRDASAVQQDGAVETGDAATGDGDIWHDPNCHVVACQGHVYACGDCRDNDGDGKADSQDPDCLGPCDNNESGYNLEIPGGNAAPCRQDCYYDQDTGGGNDECVWDHRCDDLQPVETAGCDYDAPCGNCRCEDWMAGQSAVCLDFCLPITPNGCDCFGCCELRPDEWRFLGSPGCSIEAIENCSPCTPVASCLNECGHCELCLGKTELPPDCNEQQECPEGVQPCGEPGDDPCPEGQYCVTGCCVYYPQ